MTLTELPVKLENIADKADREVLENALALRAESEKLFAEEKYEESLQKTVESLRRLRDFSSYSHAEFRAMLASLLFDLSEIHFALKDYKQSEKELEMLFKVLENMLRDDSGRFGPLHVLAMELSTRILRSRKKTLDLLAKQQLNTGILYEKVNAGVAAATDKLVESLRKTAEMLASTGDYRAAVRFYMEAIRLAKKRAGKVTRREVRLTIDMARVMMHSKSELARAKRLLNAVLPHAIALEALELEQEILQLTGQIEQDEAHAPVWKQFLEKVQKTARTKLKSEKKD